jgi:hypothetical protein
MHAALDRFFQELRADPNADLELVQEFEDAMAALYWDADEDALSQEFYDGAVLIAKDQKLSYADRCRIMLDLMKSVSASWRKPPDG